MPASLVPADAIGGVPFELYLLEPPYTSLLPVARRSESIRRQQIEAGVFVVASVSAGRDWELLARWAPRIRALVPAMPLVLWLRDGDDPEAVHLARRAGRLGIQAILAGGEPIAPRLRRTLARPEDVAADVTGWLGRIGVRLLPQVDHLLRLILVHSREHARMGPLFRAARISPAGARARLRKRGLPPPLRWLRVGRALHAALAIQHEPCRRILSIALELGFADEAALHHVLRDCFDIRPAALRQTLGWEWLAARWVSHQLRPRTGGQHERRWECRPSSVPEYGAGHTLDEE